MIVIEPGAPTSATQLMYSVKSQAKAVEGIVFSSVSTCCFGKMPACLPVFANTDDLTNKFENDFFNFTLKAPSGFTIEAKLIRVRDGSEYDINDSTYGDYAAAGSLDDPNIWGFRLQFNKVAPLLGYGQFRVEIKVFNNIAKGSQDVISPCFNLRPYSCEDAHKTVRIDAEQFGYIENGFDWSQIENTVFNEYQVRTYGLLTKGQRVEESEVIVDNQNNSRQITSGTFANWTLDLNWIGGFISDVILDEMVLAGKVLVSDYNLDSLDEYRNIPLRFLNSDEPDKQRGAKFQRITLNFEDYTKGKIKRHN